MHATTFQSRKRALRTPTVFTVSAMFRLGLLRSSDFSNRLIVSKRSDKSINRSCARIRVSRQSRRRVSRQSRARRSRMSACRGEAVLRPPCGRAQLVSILIVVGMCTRSRACVCVSRKSRARRSRHRMSRQSRLAINRSEKIVFNPSSRID